MCRLSWNLGASTSWNPQGLSRPVMGLLYLYYQLIHQSCSKWRPPTLLQTLCTRSMFWRTLSEIPTQFWTFSHADRILATGFPFCLQRDLLHEHLRWPQRKESKGTSARDRNGQTTPSTSNSAVTNCCVHLTSHSLWPCVFCRLQYRRWCLYRRLRSHAFYLKLFPLDSCPYIYIYKVVDLNPTGGMDICLLWVSCVVR